MKGSKNKKKTESFKWFKDAEMMFSKLKEFFITVSILVHFDSELRNQIETDAFKYAVTEIYTQLQVFRQ